MANDTRITMEDQPQNTANRGIANGTEIGTIQSRLRRMSIKRLIANKGHTKTQIRGNRESKTRYARFWEVQLPARSESEDTNIMAANVYIHLFIGGLSFEKMRAMFILISLQ